MADAEKGKFTVRLAHRNGGPGKTRDYEATSEEHAERLARQDYRSNTLFKVMLGETTKADSISTRLDALCARVDALGTDEAKLRQQYALLKDQVTRLHTQKVDAEARARAIKKTGDKDAERVAWDQALAISMAERDAADKVKAFAEAMRMSGVKP